MRVAKTYDVFCFDRFHIQEKKIKKWLQIGFKDLQAFISSILAINHDAMPTRISESKFVVVTITGSCVGNVIISFSYLVSRWRCGV